MASFRGATGVQIPGVLDDFYANDTDLGASFTGADAPALGADGAERDAAARHDVGADDPRHGDRCLERTGTPAWYGQEYRPRSPVYALSTGQVETNRQ